MRIITKIFQEPGGTREDTTIMGYEGSMIILIIVLILWFSTGVLLALWVKKDLLKREVKGTPYIIATLLGNIVGLSVYLLVRYNEKCALEADEVACEITELEKMEE